jgi:hypothetical protein
MTVRRSPSSAQAVAQTLSVIYSLCSFIAPYLPEWSITFVPLLPTYYLWAITLKQSLSPPGSCCEPLSPLPDAKGHSNPSPVGVLIRATAYSLHSSGSCAIDF